MLQLLPLTPWRGWPAAKMLNKDLAAAVQASTRAGVCPIFMTCHWLCSNEFLREPTRPFAVRRAAILREAERNASYFRAECAAVAQETAEVEACSRLTFDAKGSASFAARVFCRRVAATPRRGYSAETRVGGGRDVDNLRRRVAATPRPRRG